MTPPAGTASTSHAARPTRRRPPAQRPPRRVSGPSRRARAAPPNVATGPRGSVAVAPPLAVRLARAAARIGDARFLDRLLRGRAWIAVVAVALMGIVFIQVSMLRLNSGISRAIASAETLNRQNSALRAEISRMDSGERIADAADAEGMILPPAGSVNYLDARKADDAAAAHAIRPPKPVKGNVGAASSGTGTSVQAAAAANGATTAANGATTAAPATTTPQTTTTPPATTTTSAPATTAATTTSPATTTPPATTTSASTTPPATTTPQTTAAATTPPTTQTQTQAAPATPVTTTGQGGQ